MFIFAGALGILGNIVAGRMSDRLGRRTMGGVFLFLAPVFAMLVYTTAGNWVIPWWILELFFDTASATILAAYSAELFPTSYRSTAGSAPSSRSIGSRPFRKSRSESSNCRCSRLNPNSISLSRSRSRFAPLAHAANRDRVRR